MPTNRFPESKEKRELRRRDAQLIAKFCERLGRRVDYCGMPSVEYLDIEAWREHIRSVDAIEHNGDVAEDMRIERDSREYPFPIKIHVADVLAYLVQNPEVYDLYNLDFYGGFLYPQKTGGARTATSLRALFNKQAQARRDFTLITTFNVRELGADEYLRFLDVVGVELGSYTNCKSNIRAHQQDQLSRMQLCFPVFCCQQAQAHGLNYVCEAIYCYKTTSQLIHFHQVITVSDHVLPTASYNRALIELANTPLIQMQGQVPRIIREYPQIAANST